MNWKGFGKKKIGPDLIEVLSLHLPRENEENHEKSVKTVKTEAVPV
jgi:hypothetical protein